MVIDLKKKKKTILLSTTCRWQLPRPSSRFRRFKEWNRI